MPATVVFNVSGTRFEVARSTIMTLPRAYLARFVIQNEQMNGEPLFVDRDADLFRIILGFYRTAEVDVPPNIALAAVQRELDFMCIDVAAQELHVQNVGALWRDQALRVWGGHIAEFFAVMFESAWFRERMEASLEVTVVMGPDRPTTSVAAEGGKSSVSGESPGSAAPQNDPAAGRSGQSKSGMELFATKTSRRLATRILTNRFRLHSRWEPSEPNQRNRVQLGYPIPYEMLFTATPAHPKLYQLVLCCDIADELTGCATKRKRTRST